MPTNEVDGCASVDVLGAGSVELVGTPKSVVLALGDPICLCAQSLHDDGSLLGRAELRLRRFVLMGASSSNPSFKVR